MSILGTVLDYGFKIVDNLMSSSTSSKTSHTNSGISEDQLKNHFDDQSNSIKNTIQASVKLAIKDATLSFEKTIHSESNRIIDKIESDQQERILSTIKLANFYLEIEDLESAKNLTTDLILLSDYSKNRVQEGKFKWLAPWIISNSTWITIIKYGSPNEKTILAVDEKFKEFRIELLDLLGADLIVNKTCSWIEISDFINNTGKSIVPKLLGSAQKKAASHPGVSRQEDYKSITVPQLSESVGTALVSRWFVSIGTCVTTDQVLLEIETDKVVLEVQAPCSGYITSITKREGDLVRSSDIVGFIGEKL